VFLLRRGGGGGEVRQTKLYSRVACAQKRQKCKLYPVIKATEQVQQRKNRKQTRVEIKTLLQSRVNKYRHTFVPVLQMIPSHTLCPAR